jgi:tight adherence protein B
VGVADVVRCAERLALGLGAGLSWQAATAQLDADVLDVRVPAAADAARGRVSVLVAVAVVARLGAPAVAVLRRAADAVRDGTEADGRRAAAVAGPAASARVVGALPLAGPLIAAVLGVDAVGVLLGTGWGRDCAAAGLTLLGVSWWWSGRLVAGAARAAGHGREDVDDATVCDLVAAALEAGTGTAASLRAVADALDDVPGADPGSRAEELRRVADGVDLADLRLVHVRPAFAPLLDAVAFSLATGAPAGRPLQLAADEVRRTRDQAARTATARLAARLVLPLGLAALPGFLLLGVAPVVVRLLGAGLH